MPDETYLAAEPDKVTWDAIVVGTGMGGATFGYSLARSGYRVLFLEKGSWNLLTPENAVLDRTVEEAFVLAKMAEQERLEVLARAGRCIDEVEDVSGGQRPPFIPDIGSGTGGSSALYGMALERFFAADFTPKRYHADAPKSTLPESWPISYANFSPWYAAAEALFRVRGSADPLRPEDSPESLLRPAPLTAPNAELFDYLQGRGMHPYQLHMACEAIPGCLTCQGRLCSKSCKNDAGRICLLPAITQHGARLLSGCRVIRLEASRTAVTQIVCDWQGRSLTLKAKLFVLAAGALFTPMLLLNSASSVWPNGLANQSGLVGRNLMRHCFDMLLVSAKTTAPLVGKHKELAFNDLYVTDGQKLGTVQSLGVVPALETFTNGVGAIPAGLRLLKPLVTPFWRRLKKRTLVLALIMEDLPYNENQVFASNRSGNDGRQRLRMSYRLGESEHIRLKTFRERALDILKPYRPFLLKGAASNTGIHHVCGTCRFGTDPVTSVLDPTNRAHELSNLYVVDASFFPSSGGINPALTIAANALRVADHVRNGVL